MPDSNVASRLKFFIDFKELTISQFADLCGIPRPTLSQLLNGRNKKLSDVLVKLIHDKFPDLSVLWLMFGEGEMLVPAPINPALVSEAEKFLEGFSEEDNDANLSELKHANSPRMITENQHVAPSIAISMSQSKIANQPSVVRKVKSITVFYDDNSYETFLPEKK